MSRLRSESGPLIRLRSERGQTENGCFIIFVRTGCLSEIRKKEHECFINLQFSQVAFREDVRVCFITFVRMGCLLERRLTESECFIRLRSYRVPFRKTSNRALARTNREDGDPRVRCQPIVCLSTMDSAAL